MNAFHAVPSRFGNVPSLAEINRIHEQARVRAAAARRESFAALWREGVARLRHGLEFIARGGA